MVCLLALAASFAPAGCAKLGGAGRGAASPEAAYALQPAIADQPALPGPAAEWVRDGGDRGNPASVQGDGLLVGFEPSETVAEYDQVGGEHRITPSNTVSVYSPRFGRVRSVVGLAGVETTAGPEHVEQKAIDSYVVSRQDTALARGRDKTQGLAGRKRSGQLNGRRGPGVVAQIEKLEAYLTDLGPLDIANRLSGAALTGSEEARLEGAFVAAKEWTQGESVQVTATTEFGAEVSARVYPEGAVQYRSARRPGVLGLVKLASQGAAASGETIEFVLRYDNHGEQALENIVLSDSLAARLEYVPGSAQSDRAARFTTEPNEAGAETLRWAIEGELEGRAHGIVRFKARVR